MSENKSSLRYWVVNCLGCKNPIPLFAEPLDAGTSSAVGAMASERPTFAFGVWSVDANIRTCRKP